MYPLPPDDTLLGPVEMREILVHYDLPQVFTAAGDDGRLWLAVHVDEPPRADTWLWIPAAQATLDQLMAGALPLREAMTGAGSGTALRLVWQSMNGEVFVDSLGLSEVPEAWLPGPEVTFQSRRVPLGRIRITPVDTAVATHLQAALAIIQVTNHGAFVPRVQAWVRFRRVDGQPVHAAEMPARWSSAPEPVQPVFAGDQGIVYVPDPSKLAAGYVQDLARAESQTLALAIRFAKEKDSSGTLSPVGNASGAAGGTAAPRDGAWGFSPDSYLHELRHPGWQLPEELLRVDVRVRADGLDTSESFELDARAVGKAFRLRGLEAQPRLVLPSAPVQFHPPTRVVSLPPTVH